jgi:hypothetical protein
MALHCLRFYVGTKKRKRRGGCIVKNRQADSPSGN